MARQIKVDLVANARPFNNTLDAAVGRVTGFSSRLKAMGGGSIGKGLAIGAGVASFNLLTTAVSTFVGQLDVMHQAFLDDEASQARLQNALKNTVSNYGEAVKQAEDFAAAQQKFGFEDDAVRDAQFQLVGITHDLAKANELVTVSEDLARAKNIELAQAADIVARAYTGVARGLTLVGIDARGAASGQELVKRITDNTRGAMQAYANTAAGRVAAANAKMQDTFEKVGGAIDKISQVVIPIMVAGFGAIVDAAGEIIAALTEVYNFVAGYLTPAFDRFAAGVGVVADALGNLRGIAATIGNGLVPGSIGSGGGSGVVNVGGTGSGPKVTNIGKFGGSFASGGVVPGSGPMLVMAHGGERITPAGEHAGQTININIASFIGSDRDIDRFADRLAFRLRATSLS